MSRPSPCQVDLNYRGHKVTIKAAQTSIGWGWAALVDDRYSLEGEEGPLDTPSMALSIGQMQVKHIIDCDTDGLR